MAACAYSDGDADFCRSAPESRIGGSDRRSCSRSCGRSQTPCRVPPSVRRLAGEPQTAFSHLSPNTPSKASLPPLKGGSVTHVSGTNRHLCVRPLNDCPLESHYTGTFRQTHQFRPFSSR